MGSPQKKQLHTYFVPVTAVAKVLTIPIASGHEYSRGQQ